MDHQQVSVDQLRHVVEAALVAHGARVSDARTQATVLIESDLRDRASHGVRRLPVLIERMKKGLIVSRDPELTWRTTAVLEVDGKRTFGPVAAYAAVDAIVERAAQTGIALATVHDAGHVGMLAPYLERITAADCVALASTTSEALVHPWGGVHAMIGTNPIGVAVPTMDEPLVLDMSTATVSMGKIIDYAHRGEEIPLGWALDADGVPTTRATDAIDGAITPFGGPKGYALGLALEAFVAVVTKSALGREVRGTLDAEHPVNKGDVFIAISAGALGITHDGRLERYLADIRNSGAGVPVGVPGDRSRATRKQRLGSGMEVDEQLWKIILDLAAEASS